MRKRLGFSLIAVAATVAWVASAVPAFSADSGTVHATVTVAAPCLTIDRTSIDFGTKTFSQPGAETSANNFDANVASCAPTSQSLFVRGTNASASDGSGSSWALVPRTDAVCVLGPDKFQLSTWLQPAAGETPVAFAEVQTTNRQVFAQAGGGTTPYSLAAGAHLNIEHHLLMPCAGSSGAGKTMGFDIVYTATF